MLCSYTDSVFMCLIFLTVQFILNEFPSELIQYFWG